MAYVGTPTYNGDPVSTLASIIYGEAGNQGYAGMQGVGSVILNRANTNLNGYGSDVLSQALAPNQFQGQSGSYNSTAYSIAQQVYSGTLPDNTGGALYYANPSASTAAWATSLNSSNSYQIGAHYFTNNTSGVPFAGPGNNVVSSEPLASSSTGDYVDMNPADSNFGDISGLSVAGVNAPIGADSGSILSGGSGALSNIPGGSLISALGGGTPINITDLPGADTAISGAGTNVQSGLTGAANAVAGTFAGGLNALQTYTSSLFVVVALVVLGVIFIAFGLGMFGKRQVEAIV